MSNKQRKILFVYKEEGEFKIEGIWGSKLGSYYVIDNIPFFINNIACGDTVSVEVDGDELYFDELIEESGNSCIQLAILDNSSKTEVGLKFEKLKCSWEGSNLSNLISIDIPKDINYVDIKTFLDKGVTEDSWDYKEACLSEKHRNELNKILPNIL